MKFLIPISVFVNLSVIRILTNVRKTANGNNIFMALRKKVVHVKKNQKMTYKTYAARLLFPISVEEFSNTNCFVEELILYLVNKKRRFYFEEKQNLFTLVDFETYSSQKHPIRSSQCSPYSTNFFGICLLFGPSFVSFSN